MGIPLSGTVGIAIMAKSPVPGRCKTRLIPHLSPQGAAALGAAFLADATANLREAARSAPITPYVAFAPSGSESSFAGLLAPDTSLLLADGQAPEAEAPGVAGFGRCLLHAIAALLARGHCAACVLNADSPNLPTPFLVDAARRLAAGTSAVLGPAEDGGYYLLGMRRAHASLFADIDWSTEHVAAQTRTRAADIGLTVAQLPPWYDVDDPPSLGRLRHALTTPEHPGAFAAPCTTACLARIDGRMPVLAGEVA